MTDERQAPGGSDGKQFKAGENEYALMAAGSDAGEKRADAVGLQGAESESKKPLERGDVEAIVHKAAELHGISEVQHGLELSIIGGGLQTMADRYGADKLLDAMQARNPAATTIAEVVAMLAPDKSERKAVYEAIEQEPIAALGTRLNETVGGVAIGTDTGTDALERFRRFEMMNIRDGKATDGSNSLLTGDFDALLKGHPQLAENFRQTNDTFALLKDIRAVYESEYAQYTTDLEGATSEIEELVAAGEASVAELQTLSNDIFGDEVSRLEERMKATTNPEAMAMIQSLLDRRTAEAQSAREELAVKSDAIRSKIVGDLGAENLTKLRVPIPVRPQPTHPPYNN